MGMRTPSPTLLRVPILAALALAIFLVSCGISDPNRVPACSDHPEIQLRSTYPLSIAWTPRCGMTTVVVEHLAATTGAQDEVVWGIQTAQGRTVAPDVVYGRLPANAMELVAPQPLVAGQSYRVSISNTDGSTVLAINSLEFTYWPPD